MVKPIENWADVTGSIRLITESAEMPETLHVRLKVLRVESVVDYANLFSWAIGEEIEVKVPCEAVGRLVLQVGQTIRCRVQKTGPLTNHVDPGQIQVVSAQQ